LASKPKKPKKPKPHEGLKNSALDPYKKIRAAPVKKRPAGWYLARSYLNLWRPAISKKITGSMKNIQNYTNKGSKVLPSSIRRELSNAPETGNGVHRWLFTMALKLHRHLPPEDIEKRLAAAVVNCGRVVPGSEIHDAIKNSARPSTVAGRAATDSPPRVPKPKWAPVNIDLRAKIIKDSPVALAELSAMSPVRIDGSTPPTKFFIKNLFGPDDLVCVARDASGFGTHTRDVLLSADLTGSSLIVPSPMSEKWGSTQQGKSSQHTLSNTGERRYLVTEFDTGGADEQATIINHLRSFAPLVMVLWSGSKSLHAWWSCIGSTDAQQLNFFQYAVSMGADPATWTKSQFVRMPQGWRQDKGVRQQVHYFDPGRVPTLTVEGGAL